MHLLSLAAFISDLLQPSLTCSPFSQVHLLSLTGFFEWAAVRVAAAAKGNATTVFFLLSFLAGILSAFLDNVTCVMLLGPVTISLCKQMQVYAPRSFLEPS